MILNTFYFYQRAGEGFLGSGRGPASAREGRKDVKKEKDALLHQAIQLKTKAAGCHFADPLALHLKPSPDLPDI